MQNARTISAHSCMGANLRESLVTRPTSDCTDKLHLDHKGRCKRTNLTSGTSAPPHDACLKNCLLRSYFATQLRRLDGATRDVLNGLFKAACTRASTLHVPIGSSRSYNLQHRTANFRRRLPASSDFSDGSPLPLCCCRRWLRTFT